MNRQPVPSLSNRVIYVAALELSDPAARQAYLDHVCSNDHERRVQIEKLLAAHSTEQTNPLDKVVQQLGPEETSPSEPPTGERRNSHPPVIDRYKIREQIGEGGMGVVYVAEQTSPVRRKVAMKVIKPGMNSKDVVARFESERQALALMDHPNIARVLDAATMDDDRPYFVMELVNGVPITEFCDENRLTNRERLKLFIDVCSAVQHAHQKGIIHRDLKPSNIMVTMNDDKPMPKVIDFGISKALSQPLTEHSIYTAYGQMVGTPLYMSPEQAQFSASDVDTRSDVYSLGVLLYELLTGSTPFDKETLQKSGFDEMRRMIREVDPPRPSQRVSTLKAEVSSTVASCRSVDRRKLSHSLSGELDWIVMKALEKDRRRRYQSSRELADDIERYLTDRPVAACPPSMWYSVSKLAKRHRTALVAATLIFTTLLGGLVATTTQVFRASIAETALRESLANELQARRQADAEAVLAKLAAGRADAEAGVALAVNEFLQELFELTSIDNQIEAKLEPDPNITVRTLIDRASSKIDDRYSDIPQVDASINYTIGNVYLSLGALEPAALHLEHAANIARSEFGLEDPATARTIGALARLRTEQGRLQDAETLAREALEITTRLEGETSTTAHKHMAGLIVVLFEAGKFGEAKELAAKQLEICRKQFGSDHESTLSAMDNLASQLKELGDIVEASNLNEQVLEVRKRAFGPKHPETLRSLGIQAINYDKRGEYSKAADLFEKVSQEYHVLYGPEHPQTLLCQANLGHVYTTQHKLDQALQVLEPVVETCGKQLGTNNSVTLIAQGFLAKAYDEHNEFEQAIAIYRKLLKIRIPMLGEGHPDVIANRTNLANALFKSGKRTESEQEFSIAIESAQLSLGRTHDLTLTIINNAAVKMQAAGKNKEALDAFKMLLEGYSEKFGPVAIATLHAEFNVAFVRHQLGQKSGALQQLEALILRVDENLEAGHPLRLTVHMRHGFVLSGNLAIEDRHAQAAVAYRKAFDGYMQSLGRFHPETLKAMESHANELVADKQIDAAELFMNAQIVEAGEQDEPPPSNLQMGQLRQLAAKVMLNGKRTDSAIPQLIGVYDAYMRELEADDKRIDEVVALLLKAYKSIDDSESAWGLAKNHLQSLERLPQPRKGSILEAEYRIADLLADKEEFAAAEIRLMSVLTRQPALFEPVSIEAADTNRQLAMLFEKAGRFADAERTRHEEYRIKCEVLGPSDRSSVYALAGLRTPLIELEKYDEAEAVLREVIEYYEAPSGSTASGNTYRNQLVELYLAQGKFAEAERASRENLESFASTEKEHSIHSVMNHNNLANAIDHQGRHEEAEQHLRETLANLKAVALGAGTNQYMTVQVALVDLLLLQNRPTEAVQIARENYDAWLDSTKGTNPQALPAKYYLAKTLVASQQFEESEQLLREVLSEKDQLSRIRPQIYSESLSMLGECLLVKQEYEMSEPMLLEGYEGLERRVLRSTISKVERQAMYLAGADRLVRLYEATNNPTQLERWRAERSKWASLGE